MSVDARSLRSGTLKGTMKSVAVLPAVLPGITGWIAQVGRAVPLLVQLPNSVEPLPIVSTCRTVPIPGRSRHKRSFCRRAR